MNMKKIASLLASLALTITASAQLYLSATTHSLEAYMGAAVSSTAPTYVVSYQDITSAGMTIPQSSTQGSLNGVTDVTILSAPGASTTRQVAHINIYNADDAVATVYVQKDVSGTETGMIAAQLNPGNTLEWGRDVGWHVVNSTTASAFAIQSFTTSGTYTKPAGLKYALVAAVGGGGGGGSGRQGAAGENRFGGGGGGGGAVVWRLLSANDIGATVTVTVGAGGTGGAAQASTSSNGNAGTAGGDSSFGAAVVAKGGSGGGAGGTSAGSAGSGGQTNACTPAYGPFSLNGAQGSASTTSGNSNPGGTGNFVTGAAAGAGGGGISNTNVSGTNSGAGGPIYSNGVSQAGGVAITAPNGTNNAAPLLFFSTSLSSAYGLGSGGAGSFPGSVGNSGANNGSGGNGGNYGAGGGGGTGTLNGTSSGAGGTGGDGLVQVLEIY